MLSTSRAKAVCTVAVLILVIASTGYADSIVRFKTVMGDFTVQLYDDATPGTVSNFLRYMNTGGYADSFFHRLASNFVLQGGGFTYDSPVETFDPIVNEFDPGRSNLRGTLAMAKVGGNPDSATSQFFINLGDNAANLDNQNGGFTVFGEVMGNGMAVVDRLAAVQTYDMDGADYSLFDNVPVIDYTPGDPIGVDNLEIFNIVSLFPGDVNGDGYVGGYDLVPVMVNWGEGGRLLEEGELSGDGFIGGEDFDAIRYNWKQGAILPKDGGLPSGAAGDYSDVLADWASNPSEPTPMPEPVTVVLLLVGGLALLKRRGDWGFQIAD